MTDRCVFTRCPVISVGTLGITLGSYSGRSVQVSMGSALISQRQISAVDIKVDGRWGKACGRHAKKLPCAFPKVTDDDASSGGFMSCVYAKPHLSFQRGYKTVCSGACMRNTYLVFPKRYVPVWKCLYEIFLLENKESHKSKCLAEYTGGGTGRQGTEKWGVLL